VGEELAAEHLSAFDFLHVVGGLAGYRRSCLITRLVGVVAFAMLLVRPLRLPGSLLLPKRVDPSLFCLNSSCSAWSQSSFMARYGDAHEARLAAYIHLLPH